MAVALFVIAFLLNLLYELLHSLLYITCIEASLQKYVHLMLRGAIFDGFVIVMIYYIARGNIVLFISIAIAFAYFWEVYSLRSQKWEYSKKMPMILGVGATPLFQLALTGLASLWYISSVIS